MGAIATQKRRSNGTRCRAAEACACTSANGASRTGRRSCSSTAGPRTTSPGRRSTTAPWPTNSASSPATSAAMACPRRPSSPSTTPRDKLWADDVAAIIGQLHLDRPVLVGWSYDRYRDLRLRPGLWHGTHRGHRVRGRCGEARRGRLRHAHRAWLPRPLRPRHRRRPADEHLGHALVRPSVSRQAAAGRRDGGRDLLERPGTGPAFGPTWRPVRSTTTTCSRGSSVPVLVTQGRADTVVLPAMAEHILATCPTAEASWYDGVGHAPHLEDPERFNHELAELARPRPGVTGSITRALP